MNPQKVVKRFSKFLSYVLGRRPDEFGLVPDTDGFVKIKTLLKACNEENNWRHIRHNHLKEVLLFDNRAPIEMCGDLIRATDRRYLAPMQKAEITARLLYTGIRRRAHRHVSENGIAPMGNTYVILSDIKNMAGRIAKRIDQSPVILIVNVRKAFNLGVIFYTKGENIYLAESIPIGCFSGPPIPKEKQEPLKENKQKVAVRPKTPGSYLIEIIEEEKEKKRTKRQRQRKEIDWKKNRKRLKRRR